MYVCMYIHVCIYVYTNIHINISITIIIHICIYQYTCTHICTYIYLHIYIYMCIHINVYVYVYVNVFVHVYVYVYVYVYEYVYVSMCITINVNRLHTQYVFVCAPRTSISDTSISVLAGVAALHCHCLRNALVNRIEALVDSGCRDGRSCPSQSAGVLRHGLLAHHGPVQDLCLDLVPQAKI